MAFECPTCHARTIAFWLKYLSMPMVKVRCYECGASVYVDYIIAGVLNVSQLMVFVYFGVSLFLHQNIKFIAYLIVCWVVIDIVKILYLPLKAEIKK